MARPTILGLSGEVADLRGQLAFYQEAVNALELELQDQRAGWTRVDADILGGVTLQFAKTVAELAGIYYYKNPLIRRATNVKTDYVWGRGYAATSPQREVDAAIGAFLSDPENEDEIGHIALAEKERTLQIEGNLFLALFTNPATGRVIVRTIPFGEIADAVRDPDDYRRVRYYRRDYPVTPVDTASGVAVTKTETTWHPAVDYRPDPADRPETIGGKEVRWDAPVVHARAPSYGTGLWGLSEHYAALPWAHAYKSHLEQIQKITEALAKIAGVATTKTAAGAASLKANLADAPPGQILIGSEGVKFTPTSGGLSTGADEGRRYALMVGANAGVPEHILMADPSTGNLATSRTMERPFELSTTERQLWWVQLIARVLQHVVRARALAPKYAGLVATERPDGDGVPVLTGTATRTVAGPTGEPRDETKNEPPEVRVTFPSVLEHSMQEEVGAIVDLATLKGQALGGILDRGTIRRLGVAALNVPDPEDLVASMDPEDLDDQRQAAAAAPPEGDARAEAAIDHLALSLDDYIRLARENEEA
jgi:hypothetical protein